MMIDQPPGMSAVLTLLRIRNLALVEELEWQLEPGFVAITGETGAGKSIIIGALQLLLGERADKSLIRTGADLCTVEADFTGTDVCKVNPQLAEAGIEACENELDLLRQQIAEIKSANLVESEEEEIEKRYKLASNSKRLVELAGAITNKLSEADGSVLSQLGESQRLLRELEKIDNSIAQFSSTHAAAVVELSEIARTLSDYADKHD